MEAKTSYTRKEVEELLLEIVEEIAWDAEEKLIHHYNGEFRAAQIWINLRLE